VVKLATAHKHLTDIIKMLAYQAESDLLNLLRSHYLRGPRADTSIVLSAPWAVDIYDDYSHHWLHIRPSGVRPLNYPERVQKAWGFPLWCEHMRVRRIAILIDGGFFLKRLPKLVEPQFRTTPQQVADTARHLCKRHVQRLTHQGPDQDAEGLWLDHVYPARIAA
jgi:hypothetical protein